MKPVRWGMIGCGAVTEVKSGPALYKADGSTLVAVTAADLAQAHDWARRHGVGKVHDKAADLIADPEVDIVYIATPPASHMQYALDCAQAGKPAYIEKPMAQTHADCMTIIDAFSQARVPAFVAYYRRGMERFQAIKRLLDDGAIGAVRSVSVTQLKRPEAEDFHRDALPWRLRPEIAGGGKFLDMGIHTIDFLDYACGPIAEVHGIASNQAGLYEVEDIVTATWRFANGVHGTGTWCYACAEERDEVTFIGERGRLKFAFFAQTPLRLETGTDVREIAYADPAHVQQPFVQSIVDELRGHGRCPGDLHSAARASAITDEILRAYRRERGFDTQYGWK